MREPDCPGDEAARGLNRLSIFWNFRLQSVGQAGGGLAPELSACPGWAGSGCCRARASAWLAGQKWPAVAVDVSGPREEEWAECALTETFAAVGGPMGHGMAIKHWEKKFQAREILSLRSGSSFHGELHFSQSYH